MVHALAARLTTAVLIAGGVGCAGRASPPLVTAPPPGAPATGLAFIEGGRPAVVRDGRVVRGGDAIDASAIAIGPAGTVYVASSRSFGVYEMSADLKSTTPLALAADLGGERAGGEIAGLAVSRSGRYLGFIRRRGQTGGRLFVLDTGARQVVPWSSPTVVGGFSWGPGDRLVAWEAQTGRGPREVVLVEVPSGVVTKLTSGAVAVAAAQRDDGSVVFAHRAPPVPVAGVGLGPEGVYEITPTAAPRLTAPAAEVDQVLASAGSTIALRSLPGAGRSSLYEVAGAVVADTVDVGTLAAVSPAGALAWQSGGNIYMRTADGSSVRQVTVSGEASSPSFPPA